MRYLGIKGLSIFRAVCTATTPPTKKEIKVVDVKEPHNEICLSDFIQVKIFIDGKPYTIIGFRVRVDDGKGKAI